MSDEVTVWPMFGTLLGIVRDDDLIKHDDDIDLGYFKKDEAELIKKLDAAPQHLWISGYSKRVFKFVFFD